MCCTRLTEIQDAKSPKIAVWVCHRKLCPAISSQLRQVSTVPVKRQYLFHMSSQYGERRPINGWDWFGSSGHRSKFNGFRVLAALLHRRHSPEANQTLHDVSPSPRLPGALALWRNLARCKIHFTSKCCVLLYWQRYCTALQQRALAKHCDVVQGMELRNFRRGRHLHLAVRSSRWAF